MYLVSQFDSINASIMFSDYIEQMLALAFFPYMHSHGEQPENLVSLMAIGQSSAIIQTLAVPTACLLAASASFTQPLRKPNTTICFDYNSNSLVRFLHSRILISRHKKNTSSMMYY